MLVLSRTAGQTILIGENIRVHIIEIRGSQVRIGIEASREIPVERVKASESGQPALPPA